MGIATFHVDISTAKGFIYAAVSAQDRAQANIYQIDPNKNRQGCHAPDKAFVFGYGPIFYSPRRKSVVVSQTVHDSSSLYPKP